MEQIRRPRGMHLGKGPRRHGLTWSGRDSAAHVSWQRVHGSGLPRPYHGPLVTTTSRASSRRYCRGCRGLKRRHNRRCLSAPSMNGWVGRPTENPTTAGTGGKHRPGCTCLLSTLLMFNYVLQKVGLANVALSAALAFSASLLNGHYFPLKYTHTTQRGGVRIVFNRALLLLCFALIVHYIVGRCRDGFQ